MIRSSILRTLLIAAVAIAAPTVASFILPLVGAGPNTHAAAVMAIGLLALAGALIALHTTWAGPSRELDAVAARLDSELNALTGERDPDAQGSFSASLDAALDAAGSEAERQRQRADRLEVVIDSLGEPILILDASETIVFANNAAAELFQSELGALVGESAQRVVTQSSLLQAARRGMGGERLASRIELSTQRGARIFDLLCGPIPLPERRQTGAVVILRDVTDLARAARMKIDFVANASHELRTPLSAIRAALETARAAAEDDPASMIRFLDMVPAHLTRLEEMTRDLIDLSRLESPDLRIDAEPLAVGELGESLESLFDEPARQRPARVAIEFAPELEGFRTDPRLVHLALKNLIDNALKFCDPDTTVRVRGLAAADGAARRARFEVQDQGIGIPLNQQQRVFERFYQVDAARLGLPRAAPAPRKGTGLGLAIVKHAVGALGGEVGLESVYQQGTTVWFEIPELDTSKD